MKQGEIQRAYQCANLYYRHGSSQAQIAQALGISRPKVSRLLALAQRLGIVSITVKPLEIFDQSELAEKLANLYGLRRVLIGIPEENSELVIKRSIGLVFQEHLADFLIPKIRIGIGLGSTMYEMAKNLRVGYSTQKDISIIPLMGGAGQSDPAYQINNIVDLLADTLNAQRKYLMTPAICESPSQKKAFLKSPQASVVVNEWVQLDIVVFGLGKPIEESSVLYSSFPEKYLIQMVKRHAVGDILAHFFDINGTLVCPEAETILLGIPFKTLLRVPERICLAGGLRKALGIRTALKSGYITTLITDLFTAQLLAEQESP